jgi:putative salt-induced outer membrane protein
MTKMTFAQSSTRLISLALVVFGTNQAIAADGWKNESELAIITTSGNAETESYSAKQKTVYEISSNVLTATGAYLRTTSAGNESAKAWNAGLRYDRVLTEQWSVFLGVLAESNYNSGFVQKNSVDLGGKYTFYKRDNSYMFAELGARTTKTSPFVKTSLVKDDDKTENFGRAYVEYGQQVTASATFKLWVEYLSNLTNSSGSLTNAEASVQAALNENFSLKLAYLTKIDNGKAAPAKTADNTFTTSLVAKF